MKWTMYVDESGPFSKDRDNSIVGGFVTNWKIEQITARIDEAIDKIAQSHEHRFSRSDIHIAPLLFPEKAYNTGDKARYSKLPAATRQAFVDELLSALREMADCYFMSVNEGFSFGTEDGQSRYGQNLVAALKAACQEMKESTRSEGLLIAVARRGKACLPEGADKDTYHQQLVTYLRSYLNVPVRFSRQFSLGFDMADVACHFLRKGLIEGEDFLDGAKVLKSSPQALGKPERRKVRPDNMADELLKRGNVATALQLSRSDKEQERALSYLDNLGGDDLCKQLTQLLHLSAEKIDRRTTEVGALRQAYDLLRRICRLAWREFEADNTNRDALDICLSALDYAVTCVNHSGVVDTQDDFVKTFQRLLADHGHVLGSRLATRERTLALRNRAYNNEFNSYQFQRIIDTFQGTVDQRVDDMGSDKDDLTGEMCGTIGQAYAFLSRTDHSLATLAEEYFERSLDFVQPGHKYHAMSLNFLTTLHWQMGRSRKAVKSFSRHAFLDGAMPGEWENERHWEPVAQQWLDVLLKSRPDHPGTPFDVLCLLRLIAEGATPMSQEQLDSLTAWAKSHATNDHPHELIAKWIGVLHMPVSGELAINWLTKSIDLGARLGFTVKTVTLSSLGLRAVAHAENGRTIEANDDRDALMAQCEGLRQQSSAFSAYLDEIGAPERLVEDVTGGNVQNICDWLPFAYA